MPSIRSVATIRPAFPGGKFSGGALVVRALVKSVSNGSRRTTGFSSAVFSTGGLADLTATVFSETFVLAADFCAAFAGVFAGAPPAACVAAFAGAFTGPLAGVDTGAFEGADFAGVVPADCVVALAGGLAGAPADGLADAFASVGAGPLAGGLAFFLGSLTSAWLGPWSDWG